MFPENKNTNWHFILFILVLAVFVAGWSLYSLNENDFDIKVLDYDRSEILSRANLKISDNLSKDNGNNDQLQKADDKEPASNLNESNLDAEGFRNLVIKFVREIAESYFKGNNLETLEGLQIQGNWEPKIAIYYKGDVMGEAQEKDILLSSALEKTVISLLDNETSGILTKEKLEESIFLVRFFHSSGEFSFVEFNGKGIELIGDLTAVRQIDKDLILEKINQGKDFLYRIENEQEHGFYKKYDALNDSFEERLHTVYSASIIYTFLYTHDLEKDEQVLEKASEWADFLLMMQNKDERDRNYGAFHYSFYLENQEKEERFVVGTSALSIFTLLRLYDLTGEERYLESAKLAGDWLISMQREDDVMIPHTRRSGDVWVYGTKLSLLYNGQVLSSLSKLYQATGEEKYYDTAKKIADMFAEKYEKEQGYIVGEYRTRNPISNSWVVMSLMDFCKAVPNERYEKIVFELSREVVSNQKSNPEYLASYGGWHGAYSSSGTGWMSEVMSEAYIFCEREDSYFKRTYEDESCDIYKDAVIKAVRWIIQNTYSGDNTFIAENAEMALGGVFWNEKNRYVRTDSVCHGLNGYIIIFDFLDEGILLSVSEEPFSGILEKFKE